MNKTKDKKKFGKFYTSSNLAASLSGLLFNAFFKGNSTKNISILDPSCGNGVFLSEAVNQLEKVITKGKK